VAEPYIAVIGPSADHTPEILAAATEVGAGLAAAGAVVLSGGGGGVMEAASRGARAQGGQCVGILPGVDRGEGNAHLTLGLATGLGELRNALLVRCSDVLIAVGGSWGTLSEVALAVRQDKPVVAMNTWLVGHEHPALHYAETPREAVELALSLA
jgi:uncharacterized protein (TIGR00725 family)